MRVLLLLTACYFLSAAPTYAQTVTGGCEAKTIEHEQCSFNTPTLKEGEFAPVSSQNNYYEGQGVAACKNGVTSLVKPSCEVVKKTDCKVDETSWITKGAMCSHARKSRPLQDGEIETLSDTRGNGSITYQCDAGKLIKANSECHSPDIVEMSMSMGKQPTSATMSSQNAQTGVVWVPFTVSEHIEESDYQSSMKVRTGAETACLSVDDYIAGSSPDITYLGAGPDGDGQATHLIAKCGVNTTLRCDQAIINRSISGDYDSGRGEYTLPPSTNTLTTLCQNDGYTGLDSTYSLKLQTDSSDIYVAGLLCSGKQASCDTVDNGDSQFMGFTSCDTGNVLTELIRVNRGEEPTNADYVAQCELNDFQNLERVINGPRLQDDSGQFQFYDAQIACSTYVGPSSKPGYPSTCSENEGTPPPPPSVTPLTCDTARVEGYVDPALDPVTGRYDQLPGESVIANTLCSGSGYTAMDSIISDQFYPDSQYFFVVANCSGNTNEDRAQCEALGPCYGDEITLPTEEPYIEHGGKYYINECYSKPPPPVFWCEDCTVEEFTFTDDNTGHTCTVTSRNAQSGDEYGFTFADTVQNGRVNARCNNGVTNATGGECYKSCPGGVYVGWDDSNGAQSCSQRVPDGIYIHDQIITLSSSVSNTGSATARCDGYTGEWVIESGQCLLNCTNEASWGDGFSNNFINKNGLCRATPGNVAHNETGTLFSATPGTTGQTGYTCRDGELQLNNSVCDVECAETTQIWGNYCSAEIPAQESQNRATFLHGSQNVLSGNGSMSAVGAASNPPGTNWPALPRGPFPETASGSITLTCNDGVRRIDDADCKYAVRQERKDWSNWIIESSSTTKSPTDAEIAASPNTYPEQIVTTVYDEYRTRDVVTVWSDGTETFLRKEREERERVDVTVNEVGVNFDDLAVGCFVDSDDFDTPTSRCTGSANPDGSYDVTFVVGDTIDTSPQYYGSYIMRNESLWDITWENDCNSSRAFCVSSGTLALYERAELVSRLIIRHIPTGQTRRFTVNATVQNGTEPDPLADCSPESMSFEDRNNGNTCTITTQSAFSGTQYNRTFSDSNQSGSFTASCIDGDTTIIAGECYQTCTGNTVVDWNSSDNTQICSQRVPAGSYVNDSIVNLSSSIVNTGSATLHCDGNTGDWVVDSSECTGDETEPPFDFSTLTVGCFVDSDDFDTPTSRCSGTTNPDGSYNVAFVVGDTIDTSPQYYGSYIMEDESLWEISWSNDCNSSRSVCLESGSLSRNERISLSSTLTIRYIPTGQTRDYTVNASVRNASEPDPIATCSPETMSFEDRSNGNTCTITTESAFPGDEYSRVFSNSNQNGNFTARCINGSTTITNGECYETCSGNTVVDWNSSDNAQRCSQRVPAGSYVNDSIVNLSSSIVNTGSATLHCDGDTGNWVVDSSECTGDETVPPFDFSTLTVGCFVDSDDFDTPTYRCSGPTNPDGSYDISFVVGDTIDTRSQYYGSYIMEDESLWDISWSGDCSGNRFFCTATGSLSGPYEEDELISTLTIRHIPTGKTETYNIRANVQSSVGTGPGL